MERLEAKIAEKIHEDTLLVGGSEEPMTSGESIEEGCTISPWRRTSSVTVGGGEQRSRREGWE
jgi:hypothetical protein